MRLRVLQDASAGEDELGLRYRRTVMWVMLSRRAHHMSPTMRMRLVVRVSRCRCPSEMMLLCGGAMSGS